MQACSQGSEFSALSHLWGDDPLWNVNATKKWRKRHVSSRVEIG
jgi:hypothetical protein